MGEGGATVVAKRAEQRFNQHTLRPYQVSGHGRKGTATAIPEKVVAQRSKGPQSSPGPWTPRFPAMMALNYLYRLCPELYMPPPSVPAWFRLTVAFESVSLPATPLTMPPPWLPSFVAAHSSVGQSQRSVAVVDPPALCSNVPAHCAVH